MAKKAHAFSSLSRLALPSREILWLHRSSHQRRLTLPVSVCVRLVSCRQWKTRHTHQHRVGCLLRLLCAFASNRPSRLRPGTFWEPCTFNWNLSWWSCSPRFEIAPSIAYCTQKCTKELAIRSNKQCVFCIHDISQVPAGIQLHC